jgi:Tfp pilus assembly protein PilP
VRKAPLPPPAPPPPPASIPGVEEKKEPYAFSTDLANPFEPPAAFQERKGAKSQPTPPLVRYELSEWRLVGILKADNTYRAILEAPNGTGYLACEGSAIGTKGGKILKVYEEKLVIEEPVSGAASRKGRTKKIEWLLKTER